MMLNEKSKIKKMILIAIMSGIFLIFSIYTTIDISIFFRITFQNIAIYMTAIILDEKAAALVGFFGMLMNQILIHGIEPLTIFWIMPYIILGLVFGLIYKNFVKSINNNKFFICSIIFSNLILTFMNVVVLYIHSKVYHYYNVSLIIGSLFLKIISSIMTAIVNIIIIKIILKTLKNIINNKI